MGAALMKGQWISSDGFIDRSIFSDPEIYAREQEQLFTRAWLLVGHESLIPNPKDFYTSRMGEESVILCRDQKGKIHVFLNSCRHRGMKVCPYDQGKASLFVCPYHAWSYTLEGKLQGVPHYEELYSGVLDKQAHGLIEVPRMVNYKGSIWASWDPDAPDFETYLGAAKQHLDFVLDCRDGREGGSEVIGVHKWVFPANWKLAAENFLGDSYHNPSHRSVDQIGIGPDSVAGAKGRRDKELDKAEHHWINFAAGHGVHSALMEEDAEYTRAFLADPEVDEYFRECFDARKKRLGERSRLLAFTGTIFPNTSYHGKQPRGLCAWHPFSPTQTEGWRFFLVDKDAPEKVKDVVRRYYMRYSGPAGMTEQDDMENWLLATEASKGVIARRHHYNYQQSMNRPAVAGPTGDRVSLQMTEEMARNYYGVWSTYMRGGSWDELLGKAAEQVTAG
jgi:phenylpropionate dioxygenase-like ring-hydroxylating dioxygenase large terminal subunit